MARTPKKERDPSALRPLAGQHRASQEQEIQAIREAEAAPGVGLEASR
jgi:hypothetical protein